jgi:zona occludens toxin (predicted ATPase)
MEKKMRKYTLLTVLVALSLILASCTTQATPTNETQAPAAEEPTQAPAVEEPTAAVEQPTQASANAGSGDQVTLTIESWRNDDLTIWEDTIIPPNKAKSSGQSHRSF